MTVSLTKEKATKLKNACIRLKEANRKTGSCTIREIAQVIGILVASFQAVLWGPLHYRQLENAKSVALKKNQGDFEAKTCLPTKAEKDLYEMTWPRIKVSSFFQARIIDQGSL